MSQTHSWAAPAHSKDAKYIEYRDLICNMMAEERCARRKSAW
jgi:hypothetical protein